MLPFSSPRLAGVARGECPEWRSGDLLPGWLPPVPALPKAAGRAGLEICLLCRCPWAAYTTRAFLSHLSFPFLWVQLWGPGSLLFRASLTRREGGGGQASHRRQPPSPRSQSGTSSRSLQSAQPRTLLQPVATLAAWEEAPG